MYGITFRIFELKSKVHKTFKFSNRALDGIDYGKLKKISVKCDIIAPLLKERLSKLHQLLIIEESTYNVFGLSFDFTC